MIGKFFYTPKARKFDIPYRFYDPQKEQMEERVARVKQELGISEPFDPATYRPHIRGQFRRAAGLSSPDDSKRSINTRLLILIALLGICFVLYFWVFK
ncbi:MAG: hypothetical protein LBR06_02850 [Bacteroidales bacterium]|jgi:hypothetical protein|nr:hypothetical protein [Bacteroidales bacterium]